VVGLHQQLDRYRAVHDSDPGVEGNPEQLRQRAETLDGHHRPKQHLVVDPGGVELHPGYAGQVVCQLVHHLALVVSAVLHGRTEGVQARLVHALGQHGGRRGPAHPQTPLAGLPGLHRDPGAAGAAPAADQLHPAPVQLLLGAPDPPQRQVALAQGLAHRVDLARVLAQTGAACLGVPVSPERVLPET